MPDQMARTMARTKVVKALAKGLVTIPSEFRAALGIKAETLLSISLMDDRLEIARYRGDGDRQGDQRRHTENSNQTENANQLEMPLRRFSDEEIRRFLEDDRLDDATASRVRGSLDQGRL